MNYDIAAQAREQRSMPLVSSVLQRKCDRCHEKEHILQRSARGSIPEDLPPIVDKVLRSPGQPLEPATRTFMEPRFGHDFSRVRVHSGGGAAEAARALQAKAYTIESDIVFGSNEYAPETPEGRRLLAHELAHVVQQRDAGRESLSTQLYLGGAESPLEHEANRISKAVFAPAAFPSRGAPELKASGRMIQRQKGEGSKAKARPPWTVDDLKKMLNSCDGGLGIWAKAKKANDGKDPKIVLGTGGRTIWATGTITLDKTQDKCFAVQQLIQELSNMSREDDFEKLSASALKGDVSRENFIRGYEQIEYDVGVKNVLSAFDACKDKWPCKTTPKEWARAAKDFNEYFDKFLSPVHKEGYGKWWDDNCKKAYDKKHAKK
jgi:hypothetical protein